MPIKLNLSDADFETQFARFLTMREDGALDIAAQVTTILRDVKARGDAAVVEYTQRWDDANFTAERIRVDEKEIAKARKAISPAVKDALKTAASRIKTYHKKQMPKAVSYQDKSGVTLGWRWTPLDAVGLYVPGGTASYPSSVLMNAIPAKVAGVKRLVMAVPSPKGELNPAVLAAAHLAGVDEIYRIGGAQAVAALAYGTRAIAAVDKVVGPGNAWVAEAKRQVFGTVGIDMIAGPSEILVIADNKNDPDWIAADLLSQAEHDTHAQSVLITDDADFAARVETAVNETLQSLPRANIARASWEKYGAVILVSNWEEAVELANRIAPEHLELAVEAPETLMSFIRHAGAIFMGRHTPEAIGDYIAGPSHVLPTSRTARFSSGLSVLDFVKRSSIIGCTAESFKAIGKQAETLAEAEGLQAHALSLKLRG